jgi:hypothetical protein
MKKIILALIAVVSVLLFFGCTTTVTTIEPVAVSTVAVGSKAGIVESTVSWFLIQPFNSTYDVPAYKAARQGGITKIATVDKKITVYRGILGGKTTYATIVTGE